jgi:hypothetical protein
MITSLNPKAHISYTPSIYPNPSVSSAASTAIAQLPSSRPFSSTTPSFSPPPPSSPVSSALYVSQSLLQISFYFLSLPLLLPQRNYILVSVNPFHLSFASSIDSLISSPRFGRPSLLHCPVLSIAKRYTVPPNREKAFSFMIVIRGKEAEDTGRRRNWPRRATRVGSAIFIAR